MKAGNIVKFITVPLLFCCFGIVLTGIAVGPAAQPYLNLFQIVFLEKVPAFQNGVANIYQSGTSQQAGTSALLKSPSDMPIQGQQVGTLTIETAKIDTPIYWGDDAESLKKGAGIYIGSGMPGQGKTILIGGHIDSVFASLKQAKTGDTVRIQTQYGDYQYRITGCKIASDTDKTAYNLLSTKENLVLYTCQRDQNLVGLTSKRYFVYAQLLSGRQISSQG